MIEPRSVCECHAPEGVKKHYIMIAICRMKNFILTGSCFLILMAGLNTGCRKAALDKFYNPPSNLSQPIYQQLAARGNFKSLLALVDKAGYKTILGDAGYWTFF